MKEAITRQIKLMTDLEMLTPKDLATALKACSTEKLLPHLLDLESKFHARMLERAHKIFLTRNDQGKDDYEDLLKEFEEVLGI